MQLKWDTEITTEENLVKIEVVVKLTGFQVSTCEDEKRQMI
jgi:hypothetical protein